MISPQGRSLKSKQTDTPFLIYPVSLIPDLHVSMAASLSVRRLRRSRKSSLAPAEGGRRQGGVLKLSIIIISVFIKEPYTLEKALFECVCGAGRAMEIHL